MEGFVIFNIGFVSISALPSDEHSQAKGRFTDQLKRHITVIAYDPLGVENEKTNDVDLHSTDANEKVQVHIAVY